MHARTRLPIDSSCFVLQPCSPACLLLSFIPLRCAGHPSTGDKQDPITGHKHRIPDPSTGRAALKSTDGPTDLLID